MKKEKNDNHISITLHLNGKDLHYKADSILGFLNDLKIDPKTIFTIPNFEFKYGNKVVVKRLGIYRFQLLLNREFNRKIFAKNISLLLGVKQ